MSAAAIGPFRCVWRPESSGKTSKIPNNAGPIWIANHAVVSGSCSASGCALRRKSATSLTLSSFASSRTYTPLVTSAIETASSLVLRDPLQLRQILRRRLPQPRLRVPARLLRPLRARDHRRHRRLRREPTDRDVDRLDPPLGGEAR